MTIVCVLKELENEDKNSMDLIQQNELFIL